MNEDELVKKLHFGGTAVLDDLEKTYAGIRTSRPTPALVEDIKEDYYGTVMPVKQLGTITVHPPREIEIQVWDQGAVSLVAKAIEASALNLSANISGNSVRVILPALSAERREELGKYAKKIAEEHRIQIRHLRDEANKNIQSLFDSGEIGEDQKFKLKEDVQGEINHLIEAIEGLLEGKVREIEE